jgi:glycosyltransferase involved in cell wall biosynthesis
MLNDLLAENKYDANKFVVINNPITDDFKVKNENLPIQKKVIQYITVGTLHSRKGHLRLLDVLSKIDHPFHYTIIGNGEQLNTIVDQIKTKQLQKNITHIKYTNKVAEYLVKSDVFINGSYVEGFPNAMLESCAVGTPVITFNAPGGINEIIVNGINGYIVDSEKQFINTLNNINKDFIFNPKDVNQSVTSRFSKEIILKEYEKLFSSLSK